MTPSEKRRDIVRELAAAGWTLVRSSGGHDMYGCMCGKHSVPVPRHTVISPGVVRRIRAMVTSCSEGK